MNKILLSGKNKLQEYVDALNGIGCVADAEYLPQVNTDYDGLILCGGSDINPKYYGEEINGAVKIDDDRDKAEFELIDAFVKAKKPILGICRGNQLINVYFGGTLYQNMQDAELHISHDDIYNVHNVVAEEDSFLNECYGKSFAVNSSHHQIIKQLGRDLRPIAFWNGFVESFEHKSLPIIGVQWHPERMCFAYKSDDTVDGKSIFEYFVSLCSR